jgi:hypothetical protein
MKDRRRQGLMGGRVGVGDQFQAAMGLVVRADGKEQVEGAVIGRHLEGVNAPGVHGDRLCQTRRPHNLAQNQAHGRGGRERNSE